MSAHELVAVLLSDGRRLHARRSHGRGRPVVLLHGLLDDAAGWIDVMDRLPNPCLAFDLPGFGGSSPVTAPRIAAYAADVTEALAALGVQHATLVGHSLGGAVATAVAERSPAIAGLALLAPAGFGVSKLAEMVTLPGVAAVAEAALPIGLANPVVVAAAYSTMVSHRRLPSRELVGRLRRNARRASRGARAAVEAIAAAGREDDGFHRRPVGFEGPVSVLWGDRDALVPVAHAENVRRALPQASVEVWPAMGHHPQRERPDALERFIGRAVWRTRSRVIDRRLLHEEAA
jgi:pimeloyl-ACP methyl ester carboxylesterase